MNDSQRHNLPTPADIVGACKVLAGQTWLKRDVVIAYTQKMRDGFFQWEAWQAEQPIAMQVSKHGLMLDQGHHRWVAAYLAEIDIPVPVELRYDWWPDGAPFAVPWKEVRWEE